ncbi:hypothetical protein P22_1105 [Propionispora sp. 2/2-37]|uniref:hypothetical protein n=1 Tax=Propionispora sp. 2/2-37 TaxID=1677858 RepID=UPI0006BB96B5|nr:hypothetical protein [Propionispora sp. 2/2-37]CUH95036.1 hypothetical protein P22_1105 [Propionispora sp. 2/2-37]
MHNHVPLGFVFFSVFHTLLAIGVVYLLYNISRSLQRIARGMEKKEIKLQLLAEEGLLESDKIDG